MWHMRSLTPCCVSAGPEASDSVGDNAGGRSLEACREICEDPKHSRYFFLMEFFCLDGSNDMGQLKPLPSF